MENGRVSTVRSLILLLVFQHFNGNDDPDGNEDEEEYEEADPALSSCRSCRYDSLFGVAKTAKDDEKRILHTVDGPYSPSFDIFLNFRSLSLDDINGFILLFDHDTHLKFKVELDKASHDIHRYGRH
jgi:hypothetical protein